MEGIQTINALKAVQSSLPAQTTIPSNELVMLYAADGTPIAKIARDDLVKAVASVMASNSQTTFSKLLGVQANGTPMGIGASDLASVLGVSSFEFLASGSLDNLPYGVYSCNAASLVSGLPSELLDHRALFIKTKYSDSGYAAVAIDIEGSFGVYSKTSGSQWLKQ